MSCDLIILSCDLVGVGEKVGVVERIVTRLHQEREELVKTMEDFLLAAERWSHLEQEQQLVLSINKFGSCIDNCATSITALVPTVLYWPTNALFLSTKYTCVCLVLHCGIKQLYKLCWMTLELSKQLFWQLDTLFSSLHVCVMTYLVVG